MQKPQSSAELRSSLHQAVECAERALASDQREALDGVRVAFAAMQEVVEAVEAARLELLEITPDDEDELCGLVRRVRALVALLLVKLEQWQERSAPVAWYGPRPARLLN